MFVPSITPLRCFVVVVFAVVALTNAGAQVKRCPKATFALEDIENGVIVASPDGHYRASMSIRTVDDEFGYLRVYAGKKLIGRFKLRDLSAGVYVDWSPDSKAFYFAWSNGGAAGGYEVRIFRVAESGVVETPATKRAEKEFEKKHPCPGGRTQNVFALGWSKGSDELLLATQVYPTSDCGKELGVYGGYRVRVADRTILQRYSEQQIVSLWPKGCPGIYPTGF